ncbi:MAG: PAS domain-containing protein [Proteobacteria bacterium]|nr:PAS domain-containing protein [Pseudomonadota bacterium]
MKFTFRIGVYLVLATTIALLAAIGGAYQLTVTERVEQANAEVQRQRVQAKLEELVGTMETAEAATLGYIVGRSEQDLERLRQAGARCQVEIAYLAEFVAGNAGQRGRVAEIDAAKRTMMEYRQQAVHLRQQQDAAAALAFISGGAYAANKRKIEQLVDDMRREERYQATEREERFATRTRQLTPFTAWSALMAIGLALFAAAAISRQREERRLTEAHLREQEKQHRLVTSSVPAMIAYVDSQHRLQFHNHAIEELLDLPAARLDNHHLAQILGADNYKAILPEIERALHGKRVEYERKWRGKDKRLQYLAGSFIPDHDAEGRVRGFFAMLIDVSASKLAEEALRASEERWKFALEGAGDGVWDRNIKTGEVLYSRRYKEMLGYAEDEVDNLREEWESRVHPEDRPRVMSELRDYLEGRSTAYASEFRMLCKDGSWKWILSRGMVVGRDTEGKPVRMIGTHADISERMRQQEEIARVNERLDLALQGSRLALWDADIASGRIYLSEGWSEMLGEPPLETITDAESLLKIVHPEDRDRIRSMNMEALKGASPEYHVEQRVKTRSGWKWILSHGQVVKRDAEGRALRMTGTNADITARKEIERMKNEFISVVSHELRTPLSSIVGALGLLAGSADLSEQTQTLIRIARGNSQRLVRIVNDILEFEKLDSDALKIALEPVDLDALVAAAIQANQSYAEQYGVSIAPVHNQGPAWVNGNADKLMQVMANLLSNAAKFSPRGARIEVRLARAAGVYRVSVIDPGPGIPEEFKPRIFDRFAQADSSTTRQRGGTGLGLAICKMIIDKIGGKIGFVSARGSGTTFYFELEAQPQAALVEAADRGATRAA